MAYSAQEKAIAIGLVERHGGLTTEAIAAVRVALGKSISTSTLHSWLPKSESKTETETPIPKPEKKEPGAVVTASLQVDANAALDAIFEDIARRYLNHAAQDEVVKGTKGKDAVIAAATAVDKMRLLRGLPTEIVQLLPDVVMAIEKLGQNPVDVFNRIIEAATQQTESG